MLEKLKTGLMLNAKGLPEDLLEELVLSVMNVT